MAEARNALPHQRQIHLDEIVLDAACLGCGKYFVPIQGALAYRHDLAAGGPPTLNMHGNKATRVLGKVLGGIIALADGGNLELKLDQLRIEKLKKQVIRPLAIDLGKLKVLVVEALDDPSRRCPLAHSVVFVGCSLYVVQSGILRAMQAWNYHLRQAHILCPGDAVILILPQFFDREVTADAAKPFLMDDASH